MNKQEIIEHVEKLFKEFKIKDLEKKNFSEIKLKKNKWNGIVKSINENGRVQYHYCDN